MIPCLNAYIPDNNKRPPRPDQVIWDIDDRSLTPPWGDNISEDITDLSNYFVTSEGEDFLSVFAAALDKAQQRNAPLKIQTL